jgi:hypothetical protein
MMRTYERPTLTAAGSFRTTGFIIRGPKEPVFGQILL